MGGFELQLTWELLGLIGSLAASESYTSAQNAHNAYLHLDDSILSTEDLSINIKKFTPDLTGGSVTGATVKDIEEVAVDTFTATDVGAITFASGKLVGYSLLNALGVNISSNFSEIDDIIARAYTDIFGKVILANQLASVSVPLLFKDGATYISSKFAALFSNKVYDEGVFTVNETITANNIMNGVNMLSAPRPTGALIVALMSISEPGYFEAYIKEFQTDLAIAIDRYITTKIVPAMGGYPDDIEFSYVKRTNYFQFDIFGTRYDYIDVTNNRATVDISTNSSGRKYFSASSYTRCGQSGAVYIYTSNGNVELGDNVGLNTRQSSNKVIGFDGFSLNTLFGYDNVSTPVVDGIDEQIGATTPKDNDIDIGLTYPNWYGRGVDVGFLDNITKTLGRTRFIPLAIDNTEDTDKTRDRTQTVTQEGTVVDTKDKTVTVEYADTIPAVAVTQEGTKVEAVDIPDVIPQPTPTVVIPTGTTSAGLATIYNPTEAQVNALKGDLWSQNIITTLQSIFLNNPMDAIISLNKVFCTPHTNGTATIKLGYVQTSVTGVKTVDDQYTTIDCGTVNVPEIYGNTIDYEPYTNVSVFLPFIGIQNLSAKDVVGGKLQIIYRVDVTTGTCIAQLFVTKQGAKQMLYSFEGNCAVEIPLSGSNANRAIIGLASIAASTVAPGAGLALAGGAMNLVNGVNLQRSGGFQSNAGAMNNKKPYLIINRVLPYDATGYNQIYGYPSNNRVLLNSVTGYTRVKDVHVEGISCTDYEKNMIEEQLKAGILL